MKTHRNLGNAGYGIIETTIVIIIFGVLTVVFMDHFERTEIEAKKTAVKAELMNLRQSIELFKILKGRYPEDLKELIGDKYVLPYRSAEDESRKYINQPQMAKKYIDPTALDKNMNMLDPFGLPYLYYPLNGSVRSQKQGFEYY